MARAKMHYWKALAWGLIVAVLLASPALRAAWETSHSTRAQPVFLVKSDGSALVEPAASGDVDGLEAAIGTTADAKADVDGNGSVVAQVRRIAYEADRLADAADTLTGSPAAKALTQFSAVVAAGPTKAPLAASQTWARKVVITAVKATGAANTGVVYIGDTNLVDTTACGTPLVPGDSLVIDPGLGCKVDLNTIYVDGANAADGVSGWYIPL